MDYSAKSENRQKQSRVYKYYNAQSEEIVGSSKIRNKGMLPKLDI